jgi:hypothetical protein
VNGEPITDKIREREPPKLRLPGGRCPDCGEPPEVRGREPDETGETQGDACTHPCHDEPGA